MDSDLFLKLHCHKVNKTLLICIMAVHVLLLKQPLRAQTKTNSYTPPPELAHLLQYFQHWQKDVRGKQLPPPLLLEQDDFGTSYQVRLGRKALGLQKRAVVLRNPFGTAILPLSYSVIYQKHLIALFEPGYFACYNLRTLARNKTMEQQLNRQQFQYHWLLDNQLVGLAGGQYLVLNAAGAWVPYPKPVPFLGKQPKLFEDERYLSFQTCNGEFGGRVYFYDKQHKQYYLTEATCPNSITKHNGRYWVLASLGHGLGHASMLIIDNPARLTHQKPGDDSSASALLAQQKKTSASSPSQTRTAFSYYGIQMFSSFVWHDQQLYVVNLANRTFLATVENNCITVVDPLFNDRLYTHHPVTTTYGSNLSLMNLDFYGQGGEKEVICLLFTGNQVTRIDWGRKFDIRNR